MRTVRVYVKDIRENDRIRFPRGKECGRVFRKRLIGDGIYELTIQIGGEEYTDRFSGTRMLSMRIE